MRPAIRALVGDLFYGGRLRDAGQIGLSDPETSALVLLETGRLDPVVSRVDGSRENQTHVEVVTQLLEILGREGVTDVGVVTPYRAQTRSLWRSVRGRLGRAAPAGLEISTIHRFQGREKSVVILDTVDAPPGPSWFLNENRNPDFPRLLNVALSRSKNVLILVGTTEGLKQTLPSDALLNRVVDRISSDGETIDARRPTDAARLVTSRSNTAGGDMKVVVQRVSRASVRVEGRIVGEIETGLLVLVGFAPGDGLADLDWMARKIRGLRLFRDEDGLMNRDVSEIGGSLLVVSQFTLYGDASKGRRPSFVHAAPPEEAERLYHAFVDACRAGTVPVAEGRFGAMMDVELLNDGPVTLVIER